MRIGGYKKKKTTNSQVSQLIYPQFNFFLSLPTRTGYNGMKQLCSIRHLERKKKKKTKSNVTNEIAEQYNSINKRAKQGK